MDEVPARSSHGMSILARVWQATFEPPVSFFGLDTDPMQCSCLLLLAAALLQMVCDQANDHVILGSSAVRVEQEAYICVRESIGDSTGHVWMILVIRCYTLNIIIDKARCNFLHSEFTLLMSVLVTVPSFYQCLLILFLSLWLKFHFIPETVVKLIKWYGL